MSHQIIHMSQTKNYKSLTIFLFLLLGINLALVFLFPSKPLKIKEIELPKSPIDAQIRITFSEPVDQKNIEENFKFEPETIKGKISWTGKTLVFTPNNNLDFEKTYSISLPKNIKSLRNSTLKNPYTVSFTTPKSSFFYLDKNGYLSQYFPASKENFTINNELKIRTFDYSPSEKLIFAIDEKNAGYLINPETKETEKLDFETKINHGKWIPFENSLIISQTKAETELIKYDLEKEKTEILKTGDTLAYEIFISPDGSYITLIDETGALSLYSLESKKEELITREFLEHFGFSEYGGYLLYTVLTPNGIFDPRNNLMIFKSNGEKEILLENSNAQIDQPQVSPDETKLIFKYKVEKPILDFETPYYLAAMDIETREITILTPEDITINEPKFSPEGKFISFIKDETEILLYKFAANSYEKDEIISTRLTGSKIEWAY